MSNTTLPKVAVVVSHPIQHFCPLYRAVSASGALSIKVFFGSSAGRVPFFDPDFGQKIQFQEDLTTGFDHEFLPGCPSDLGKTGLISNPFLGERLSAYDPDVIHAYGYRHPISRDAMKWARRHQRAILYCSDAELLSPRPLWNRMLKRVILSRIFSRCDGFLTVGDCNEQYYRQYGVQDCRFWRCPFPIDEERLNKALLNKAGTRRDLREKLKLPPDALVLLVVGKLTPRKSPKHVIQAVANLWKMRTASKPYVVFAGNGPEAESLRSLADSIAPDAVRFAGFVNVADLPDYYVSSDILAHPSSQDPHPLAVSEAVFTGLPVIVSDRVGSSGPTDDVRVGQNGLSYPYGDINQLTDSIRMLCDDPHRREVMARNSLEIGRARSLRASTEAYIAAARQISRRGSSDIRPVAACSN